MKNDNEIETVNKIKSHYVGDDCIQFGIDYMYSLTLFNKDETLYHHSNISKIHLNKYLEDERRKQFPYSNIPIHYNKKVGMTKITYTNQLLEFEKPYIVIKDNHISEYYVVKDKSEALLVTNRLDNKIITNKNTKHMTYDELLNFLKECDKSEQIYYIQLDGSISIDSEDINNLYPNEKNICNYIKCLFMMNVKELKEYQKLGSGSSIACYLRDNPLLLKYFEKCIKNIDLSLIDFNIPLYGYVYGHVPLLIIKDSDLDTVQALDVTFVKKGDYKVDIYDLELKNYTLDQLKDGLMIENIKEPKIPLRLNPDVTRQDIKKAKQMVKSLRK